MLKAEHNLVSARAPRLKVGFRVPVVFLLFGEGAPVSRVRGPGLGVVSDAYDRGLCIGDQSWMASCWACVGRWCG